MKSINVLGVAAVTVVLFMSCTSIGVVIGALTFREQLRALNDAIENWYKEELNARSEARIDFCLSCPAQIQSKYHRWPRQMMEVLQLATEVSSSDRIDFERLVKVVAGLNDEPTKQKFRARLKKSLATKKKFKDITSIQKRKVFNKLVEELCNPYRAGTKGATLQDKIERLIELKKQENMNDFEFYNRVVYTNDSIFQLYAAAMICQIIDATTAKNNPSGQSIKLILPRDSGAVISTRPYPAFHEGYNLSPRLLSS